jgi:hypothetical protein
MNASSEHCEAANPPFNQDAFVTVARKSGERKMYFTGLWVEMYTVTDFGGWSSRLD